MWVIYVSYIYVGNLYFNMVTVVTSVYYCVSFLEKQI